jgi:hypothetical protein
MASPDPPIRIASATPVRSNLRFRFASAIRACHSLPIGSRRIWCLPVMAGFNGSRSHDAQPIVRGSNAESHAMFPAVTPVVTRQKTGQMQEFAALTAAVAWAKLRSTAHRSGPPMNWIVGCGDQFRGGSAIGRRIVAGVTTETWR